MTEELRMIEELPVTNWTGPFADDVRARAVAALESGSVLYFPHLPFPLQENEKQFLNARVSDGRAKNISLDPATGKLQATSLTGEKAKSLGAMIERFGVDAANLMAALLPYAEIERARTSFRPMQVKGRTYSRINDDRLLHVDAFPTRPMHGRRILRFFANVAPLTSPDGGHRRWLVGEPFEDFAKAFLPRLRSHIPGQSRLLSMLGITRGTRSRYDEMMLSLHDTGKLDETFQSTSPRQAIAFPPGSCWAVYTDQVLHAALGGEFALEQTFHLDIGQMADQSTAPLKILERLSGRILV